MMPQMDRDNQLAIIVACFTLHNFVRLHELQIPISHQVEVMEPRADYNLYDAARQEAMNSVRLTITNEIWSSIQDPPEFNGEEEEDDEEEELTDYDSVDEVA